MMEMFEKIDAVRPNWIPTNPAPCHCLQFVELLSWTRRWVFDCYVGRRRRNVFNVNEYCMKSNVDLKVNGVWVVCLQNGPLYLQVVNSLDAEQDSLEIECVMYASLDILEEKCALWLWIGGESRHILTMRASGLLCSGNEKWWRVCWSCTLLGGVVFPWWAHHIWLRDFNE